MRNREQTRQKEFSTTSRFKCLDPCHLSLNFTLLTTFYPFEGRRVMDLVVFGSKIHVIRRKTVGRRKQARCKSGTFRELMRVVVGGRYFEELCA